MPTARLILRRPYRFGVFDQQNTPGTSAHATGRNYRNSQASYLPAAPIPFYNAALGRRIGTAAIAGTTQVKGTPNIPVSRPVVLFDSDFMLPLAWTVSLPDGHYRFTGLQPGKKYVVAAFDTAGLYRATIADNLTAELAP